jgi:hypothetical protein
MAQLPRPRSAIRRVPCTSLRSCPCVGSGGGECHQPGPAAFGHQAGAASCRLPGGCDQPAAACEVHHLTHKANGGKTSVKTCGLYCGFHHQTMIHRWVWTVTLNPDGTTAAAAPTAPRSSEATAPRPRRVTPGLSPRYTSAGSLGGTMDGHPYLPRRLGQASQAGSKVFRRHGPGPAGSRHASAARALVPGGKHPQPLH